MGMKEIPSTIRPQVESLLKIQDKHDILQAEFNKKVLELELEYETKYAPLYTDRSNVIQGSESEKVFYACLFIFRAYLLSGSLL